MATFQGDVLLTAFFLNNLTGTGRIKGILKAKMHFYRISD